MTPQVLAPTLPRGCHVASFILPLHTWDPQAHPLEKCTPLFPRMLAPRAFLRSPTPRPMHHHTMCHPSKDHPASISTPRPPPMPTEVQPVSTADRHQGLSAKKTTPEDTNFLSKTRA